MTANDKTEASATVIDIAGAVPPDALRRLRSPTVPAQEGEAVIQAYWSRVAPPLDSPPFSNPWAVVVTTQRIIALQKSLGSPVRVESIPLEQVRDIALSRFGGGFLSIWGPPRMVPILWLFSLMAPPITFGLLIWATLTERVKVVYEQAGQVKYLFVHARDPLACLDLISDLWLQRQDIVDGDEDP